MLKSSVRTNEVPVMGMEEWAQVVVAFIDLKQSKFSHSNTIGISCMTKKAHFRIRRKETPKLNGKI